MNQFPSSNHVSSSQDHLIFLSFRHRYIRLSHPALCGGRVAGTLRTLHVKQAQAEHRRQRAVGICAGKRAPLPVVSSTPAIHAPEGPKRTVPAAGWPGAAGRCPGLLGIGFPSSEVRVAALVSGFMGRSKRDHERPSSMASEGSGPSGSRGLFEQLCLGAKTSFGAASPRVNDVGTKSETVKGRVAGGAGQTLGGCWAL